jgi:hypothetical protein
MAYLYVKSDGTATGTAGRYTTQKTGSWSSAFSAASEYYGDLATAATNASAGDIILISNVTTLTVTTSIGSSPARTDILSVSDSQIQTISYGAQIALPSNPAANRTITLYARIVNGVYLNASNSNTTYYLSVSYAVAEFVNCIIRSPEAGANVSSRIAGLGQNSYTKMYIRDTQFTNICVLNTALLHSTPYGIEFTNCSFSGEENGTQAVIDNNTLYMGFIFKNCDFSGVNRPILSSSITGVYGNHVFLGCTFAANSLINNVAARFTVHKGASDFSCIQYENCSGVPDSKLDYWITAENTTAVYRSSGALNKAGNSYSIKVTAVNDRSTLYQGTSPVFLGSRYLPSGTYTCTLEIAQNNAATALKTGDVILEAYSSTDFASSIGTLIKGTADLDSSSATWTGLTTPTKQKISVSLSVSGMDLVQFIARVGAAGTPVIYICPSVTVA